MGQFSWMFADTDNEEALNEGHSGYLATPTGPSIFEPCYDGYGRFNGEDAYDLVADWNRSFLAKNPDYLVPQHGSWLKADGTWEKAEALPVSEFKWYKAYANLSLNREEVVKEADLYEYRYIGIDIACYDDQNAKLPFPIKVCKDPANAIQYYQLPASENDPNQGWGSELDEEDED